MFTPKGLSVSLRVSRIAWRRASGEGCESAVSIPRPPALETAAARGGNPTLDMCEQMKHNNSRAYHCMPPCTTGLIQAASITFVQSSVWIHTREY